MTVVFKSPKVSEQVFRSIQQLEECRDEEESDDDLEDANLSSDSIEVVNKNKFQLTLEQQQTIYNDALEKAKKFIKKPMEDLLFKENNDGDLSSQYKKPMKDLLFKKNNDGDLSSQYKVSSRTKNYIRKRYYSFFPASCVPAGKDATLEDILQFLTEIKDLPLSMSLKIVFIMWEVAVLFLMAVSVAALIGVAPLLGSLTTSLAVSAGLYVVGVSLWSRKYQQEKKQDQEYLAKIFFGKDPQDPFSDRHTNPAHFILNQCYENTGF
jgi:hypothetical protein